MLERGTMRLFWEVHQVTENINNENIVFKVKPEGKKRENIENST